MIAILILAAFIGVCELVRIYIEKRDQEMTEAEEAAKCVKCGAIDSIFYCCDICRDVICRKCGAAQ